MASFRFTPRQAINLLVQRIVMVGERRQLGIKGIDQHSLFASPREHDIVARIERGEEA